MGTAFTFILKRFYYSLASGFIINFFFVCNFYFLVYENLLPDNLKFLVNLPISEPLTVTIFVVLAVMIGVVIEGINEFGFQYYTDNAKKLVVPKKKNPEKTRKTFIGFLFWHVFRRVATVEANISCWKKEVVFNNETKKPTKEISSNSIFAFMNDPKYKNNIEAMTTLAEKFEEDENGSINRFRDLSFIFQFARLSFLLIAVFSFFAFLVVLILHFAKGFDGLVVLGGFYLFFFVLSAIIVVVSAPITYQLGIRYVYDIGAAYKASKI